MATHRNNVRISFAFLVEDFPSLLNVSDMTLSAENCIQMRMSRTWCVCVWVCALHVCGTPCLFCFQSCLLCIYFERLSSAHRLVATTEAAATMTVLLLPSSYKSSSCCFVIFSHFYQVTDCAIVKHSVFVVCGRVWMCESAGGEKVCLKNACLLHERRHTYHAVHGLQSEQNSYENRETYITNEQHKHTHTDI